MDCTIMRRDFSIATDQGSISHKSKGFAVLFVEHFLLSLPKMDQELAFGRCDE